MTRLTDFRLAHRVAEICGTFSTYGTIKPPVAHRAGQDFRTELNRIERELTVIEDAGDADDGITYTAPTDRGYRIDRNNVQSVDQFLVKLEARVNALRAAIAA